MRLEDLDNFLRNLPSGFVNWEDYYRDTKAFSKFIFSKGLGDTRQPTNEVTLKDWGWTVAALFKGSVVKKILSPHINITDRNTYDLSWRLLSLRTDGLAYMLSAPSIPDLLVRKELLTSAWNQVQRLLEEGYPLGLEVYRDENGPVFVVPDLDNLLGLENPDDNHKTLREYILEAFRQGTVKGDPCLAIDGEVVPVFKLDEKPWKGQPAPAELPPIGDHLNPKKTPPLQSDPAVIAQFWCNHGEEICSVCGLRPQGPGRKAKSRKICNICEERRADRAKAWAVNLGSTFLGTIWLDEVADANGRLALLVGQFDLSHWLAGTLVHSLAVLDPSKCEPSNRHCPQKSWEYVSKNPSFARLRRIWETTRRFWQEVAPTDAPPEELQDFCNRNGLDIETLWEGSLSLEKSLVGEVVGKAGPRLLIHGELHPHRQGEDPGPYHAYELRLGRVKLGVLWDPERKGFITLENLVYIAKQLGHKLPKPESREGKEDKREFLHRWAAKVVKQEMQAQKELALEEPTGYGSRNREWGTIRIYEVELLPQPYVPTVPTLAEPRTFMALVPADKALDVVRAIKVKYEREIGKVRNRLPLHLGIVFADAHQPLRTILDAGRRMLAQKAADELWRVVGDQERQMAGQQGIPILHITEMEKPETQLEDERPELIYEDPQRKEKRITNQYKTWHRIILQSQKSNRIVSWYVPAVMGDGKTPDNWYPYVFWKEDKDGNPDPGSATQKRSRYYQAPNPFDPDKDGNPRLGWVVHAGELKEGDAIYFTPATLDFIWLDHGGTRFEIAYDEKGWRRGTLHRPYLLDEVDDLLACWELLAGDREKKIKRLGTSQLHVVRDLIETKRAEWFKNPQDSLQNKTFRAHCESVLKNAQWATKPTESELNRLTHWAVTGVLADAVELFYHILKQRPVGEENDARKDSEPTG